MNAFSEIPISRTKVIVPERRADLLSRPRLLGLMYELLDKKLALISAPAGYGKTSALIDLAQQSELPTCWLSLDNLDRDPQRFILYFIAALSQRFPKFGGQTKALLNGLTSLEEEPMERMVVTLVNELYDQVREHFVVILDDYHLVDDVSEIERFVNRFIQLADENCHLIISSRTLISLPVLPLMVARQQVDGLSNLELAFRADEIQSLFGQNYHTSLSKTDAQALEQESEGWITGLQLSSMVTQQEEKDTPRVKRASGVGLFEYFGQQVLDQQPKELREFLLRSSLLEEFNTELCEKVLGPFTSEPQDWTAPISAILQKNLFALPVGNEGNWLRYHHLFRDFLQSVVQKEEPDLIDSIFYRLAEVHAEEGEWEKAYHTYLQMEDFEALSDLVEKAGTPLQQNGRLLTLRAWLDNIPEELRQSRPGLLSLEGITACMIGDIKQGLSSLNQAEDAFRAAGDIRGLSRLLVRRTTAHQYQGNYTASFKDVEEALDLIKEQEGCADINLDALRSKGLSLYHLGDGAQAVEWLNKALDGFTRHEKKSNALAVLVELGMVYASIGNFETAQSSYEEALNLGKETGNLTLMANLLNNMGVLYHLQGEYEKAIQTFEEGLDAARRSGYLRMEVTLLISLGDLYADFEELEAAHQSYQQAGVAIQPENDHFLYQYLILAEARIARVQKKYSQARQLLATAQIQEGDSAYERGLFHLERGRLAVTEEDTPQALRNLKAAKRYFEQDGRTLEHAWSQLWLSSAAYQSGDMDTARAELQDVLEFPDQEHFIQTILPQVQQTKIWLSSMQEDPVIGATLSDFMEQVAKRESRLPATRRSLRRIVSVVPMSAPRLSILALGRAQVKINGETIAPSDWKTQSVRDLFFYFLTASQAMSKEQIGLVFWPDIDPAKLKMRFKNNLYRLRRALGPEVIVFEDDRYAFNHGLDYDYDVETFDAHLAQAKVSSDSQEQIDHYQAAIDLMRGSYLSDVHMTWVWPERERLNQVYISVLVKLSRLYLNNMEPEKARKTC